MNKENKLLPELRFPEFEKYGEWEEKKLGSIGEPLMCKRIFKDQTTPDSEYGIPFYKIGTFGKKADSFITVDLYIEFKSKYNFPNKGDILISASGTIGRLVIYDGAPAYFQDSNIIWLGHDGKQVTNEFLFYCYSIINWQTSDGGVIKRLYNSDLKNISIRYPENKLEQQKIAYCLSSLDELISAQSDKLDALKDHKKGLMQNLFPQEGQKVPNYRFPEFEKDGEWVEIKLGEGADFINGRAYKQDELLSQGKYRVLRVGNFFTNNEWYYSDLELGEDKYCKKGDLLYAWSASFGPHIWKEEKVIYHYHIWKVKNKEGINRQFLYNLLDYETLRMKSKTLNGFALMHITKSAIENWDSIIPKSEKEQQKIASCLSALDELITAQSEMIEQLQQHKKGLMQGLFPKIES